MPGNEIPAAAEKILKMIADHQLDGSESDVDKLMGVYARFRITRPEEIARVNETMLEMKLENIEELGKLEQLKLRIGAWMF